MALTDDSDYEEELVTDHWLFRGEVQVPSLIAVICFYFLILVVGIVAYYVSKRWTNEGSEAENTMLAGRNIGIFIGVFTMTDGTFFAKTFRENRYVTMLDPIQIKYGRLAASFLYLPSLVGDLLWSASILSALGGSLVVIVGLRHEWSVVISAAVSVSYTLFGGFYSVAVTDVVQLISIFVGLWVAAGYALIHPAVGSLADTAYSVYDNATGKLEQEGWLGTFPTGAWLVCYIDVALAMMIGGIPWQVYYQRACAQRTVLGAQVLSYVAAVGCVVAIIPAVIIGAVAKSADWNATAYSGPVPLPRDDYKLVLPLVLQFLTPAPVAVIGLGALSAAVMSSCDSSILASATMFARNVYSSWRHGCTARRTEHVTCARTFSTTPTDTEIIWVMRASVMVIGGLACLLAIKVNSVYGLFYLSADMVYVLFFPTLLTSLYMPAVNTTGVLAGYATAILLRLAAGERLFSFPPLIKYPYYDEETNTQLFPFKTFTMLMNLSITLSVSYLSNKLGKKRALIALENGDIMTQELNVLKPMIQGNDAAPLAKEEVEI